MKIYHYDKVTKQFLGESEASLDPVATLKRGDTYLLPACATFEMPPESIEGKYIIWDGKWVYVTIPEPPIEPIPTKEELEAQELERKIRVEMDRILREQAIASLKAREEI